MTIDCQKIDSQRQRFMNKDDQKVRDTEAEKYTQISER